jgi:hypothetical protein
MGKNPAPDPGSGMMNNPDHFSECLRDSFRAKNVKIKLFDADPDPGSRIFLIPDPRHSSRSTVRRIISSGNGVLLKEHEINILYGIPLFEALSG